MSTFLWLTLAALTTTLGDLLIKHATLLPEGLRSGAFYAGVACYAAPALAWFFLLSRNSLSSMVVCYSAATLVVVAVMGALVFREPLGWREALGVALALASVWVMQGGGSATEAG